MSTAIASGLYHPRCKDSHTTYFPGISTPPDDKFTKKELTEIEKTAKHEAKQQYASRQADKFGRMAKYSLDEENQEQYFEKLNAMLRGDLPEEEWLKKYADTISGAVKKNKLRHDVICYRNMEFNPYEKYVVGDIVTEKQFISTSVTKTLHSIRILRYYFSFRKDRERLT